MYSKIKLFVNVKIFRRFLAQRNLCSQQTEIRNIGILAHIDAGKTTTTERLLFYAGKTRSLGEVHRGNTITDYLTQERERGITICSSAVTFPWGNSKINLLDTPGHIDFTMEVEQSLNAVDGVVIVLDGTGGVEAQTLTVWSQANRHALPKIVFINKMDRPDANFEKCLTDVSAKLDAKPLCLQYPVKDSKGNLDIIDVVTLQRISWNLKILGRVYNESALQDHNLKEMRLKRNKLIDTLTEFDDELANFILSNESYEKVSNELVYNAIRRSTCRQGIVPVILGSAYKNIGIQLLADSLVRYLPPPHERNLLYECFGNDFVGKVFKIVHDKQRGPLTLVRVFRGKMTKGMRVTTPRGPAEILQKIYEPLANEYREINEILSGDVGVCSGLNNTVTGDLIASSISSLMNAQNKIKENTLKLSQKVIDSSEEVTLQPHAFFSIQPNIPDAVYFCSVEPPSLSAQQTMEKALKQLQREDPSLRVTYDDTTGQTVLGGMGELHLDVIKSRILTEYKIDVDLGPLQIAYKETANKATIFTWSVEKEIAGSKQSVTITMELVKDQEVLFRLDNSPENVMNLNSLKPRTVQVIKKGVLTALNRGPRVGGKVINSQIKLHSVLIGRGTADSFVMAAAAQCVQKVLKIGGTCLLEPMMSMEIALPSERVSVVLADLCRRRGVINDVLPKGERNKIIYAVAPLAELSGYSSAIRTISSGTASMTMQPCGYSNMSAGDEIMAIKRAQGIE